MKKAKGCYTKCIMDDPKYISITICYCRMYEVNTGNILIWEER